jgi:transglutaminase-like putative cysteine protease
MLQKLWASRGLRYVDRSAERGTSALGRSPLAFLQDLAAGVHCSFSYAKKSAAVSLPIEHALQSRQGVCQDFAHFMISLARNAKIPCRYVCGYVYHSENAHASADGAAHAWVEAFFPGVGWLGFDPTIDRPVGEGAHSRRHRSRLWERSIHSGCNEGANGHAASS